MLDVHDVLRAAGEGRVYLEWVDEDGVVVGFASVQNVAADQIDFFYRFYGTRNVERGIGQLQVEVRRKRGGKYWDKPSFVCPRCARDVTRLFCVRGRWACKQTHDLCGISQRLDQVNKAIYLREVHERDLRRQGGDPSIIKKIAKRKNKYGAAVSLLANADRPELPWHLQFRCFGRWLEPGEVPKEQDKSDPGYGWVPGMSGQLPGLEPTEQKIAEAVTSGFTKRRSPRPRTSKRPAAPMPRFRPGDRAPGYVDPLEKLIGGLDLFAPIDIRIPGFNDDPPD